MDEYEIIPIDGDSPTEDDIIPTEDETEEIEISDEPYGPTEPTEPDAPEQADEGDEPEPAYIIEPNDEDVLPTEEEAEEIVIDDEEYTGGGEPEPDIDDNEAEITMVGAVREGDVFPALKLGSSLMGIAPAGWGDRMQSDVDLASQAATEAKAVAQATGQHFWEDDNGAHVTEITKDEWKAEEAKETPFADVSDAKPYHNLLMNSLGILLRTALKNLVSITRSAIAFFDGKGNEAANVTASFGKDGFQAGVTGESHLVGDYHSLQLVDSDQTTYFHVSDLRDRTGQVEVTETFFGDGATTQFTISLLPDPSLTTLDVKVDGTSVANAVIRQKVYLTDGPAPDGSEVAITYTTEDSRAKAYTFGIRSATRPVAPMSYALGDGVAAAMPFAYAEGDGALALGYASHSEGFGTVARGGHSHAEGYQTEAGPYAHAEGLGCMASGPCSHANGRGTVAASEHQTAIGHYNVEDANGDYALIIGNGTSDSNRSNALTVGWDGSVDAAGDASIAGDVSAGGALAVTGDATMGGTLGVTGATTHESTIYVNGANVNNMWMRDEYANADYDGVPSSGANTTRTVGMIDSDDDQLARVSFRQRSDGRRCAGLEAHGFNSGGTGVWNSLWAVVDKAGNRSYEMSDPAAFREALRMRSGVVATRSVAAGSVTTVDITFSPALSSAPNVVCGLQSTQTQLMGSCSCVVTATSATGFTVALVNNSSSARNLGCYWIAM